MNKIGLISLMHLPQRIFLDTCVINLMVDYSECLFENQEPNESVKDRVYDDINALRVIFNYANHNPIKMIISDTTFKEIESTANADKRRQLIDYCTDLSKYFHQLIGNDYRYPGYETRYYEEYLLDKGLGHLIDRNDRRLIIEALFYPCDVFCTRDYKTILKHRHKLQKHIPLEIVTPLEWLGRYHHQKAY